MAIGSAVPLPPRSVITKTRKMTATTLSNTQKLLSRRAKTFQFMALTL